LAASSVTKSTRTNDDRSATYLTCTAGASLSLITPDSGNGCDPHGDSRFQKQYHQEIYIMKPVRTLSTALVMSALLVALSGCERQEGPMEKVGKSIDNTAESGGEHVENSGAAIQDAAKGDKK
jgi:hypothetical protein